MQQVSAKLGAESSRARHFQCEGLLHAWAEVLCENKLIPPLRKEQATSALAFIRHRSET
jgi:hypothetical protein